MMLKRDLSYGIGVGLTGVGDGVNVGLVVITGSTMGDGTRVGRCVNVGVGEGSAGVAVGV